MVTGDLLALWRAKYNISSSVEMVVPSSSNKADDLTVGCAILNPAVLNAGLCLSIPKVVHMFLSP